MVDVIVPAVQTWAVHSSVAIVLLTMSLAAQGAVPPHAAFALVLGANLGTAINPVLEGAPAPIPLPVGCRSAICSTGFGCVVASALLDRLGPLMGEQQEEAERAACPGKSVLGDRPSVQEFVWPHGEGGETGNRPASVRLAAENVYAAFGGRVLLGALADGECPDDPNDCNITGDDDLADVRVVVMEPQIRTGEQPIEVATERLAAAL